jgi:hypothetical protein
MGIPTFTRAYEASADVLGYRIVKFSDVSTSSKVATAAASTSPLIGVSDAQGASSGDMLDVHRAGLAPVQLGGSVSAGDPLTADEDGKAIKAVAADDTTIVIIGTAEQPGVEDDIIDAWLAAGTLTKPNAAA